MNEEKYIREELVFHLYKGNAHMTFEDAVANFPEEKMNTVFPNGDYTFWHLLEHIRRTQHDILDFLVNPEYKELEWPKDYWPEKDEKATNKIWGTSVQSFLDDREALKKFVEDPQNDLYKKIAWGNGQTIFREIIVVIDHNAYHLGEFAIMRQALNAWDSGHR